MKNPSLYQVSCVFLILILFSKPSYEQALDPPPLIPNPKLFNAYIALQAWKHAITSDPKNFTTDWYGPDVCNYTGVYCAPAQDDSHLLTVAGIDLNHAQLSGYLPEELGLLSDLALFHINSNLFYGTIPQSFKKMKLLHEIDVSNNNFSGKFPDVLLNIPSLKFLDIRYNQFEGRIPKPLFDLKLDAIFINNNKFQSSLPENIGNSPVSVIVLANNNLNGCFPSSLANMSGTLREIILMNAGLKGCLPPEIGKLDQVTVFDISSNQLIGELPETMGKMKSLEQLNIADNKFSGNIPESICSLPRLENFTYSDNYFCGEPKICLKLPDKDDRKNCIPDRPKQRSLEECKSFYAYPPDCGASGCSRRSPPPPSPPPPSPPPPHHDPYFYPFPPYQYGHP